MSVDIVIVCLFIIRVEVVVRILLQTCAGYVVGVHSVDSLRATAGLLETYYIFDRIIMKPLVAIDHP